MPVVTVKSAGINNASSQPVVASSANLQSGNIRESQGLAAVTNGDSIASIYRLFKIKSSDRVSNLLLYCTAITSAAADFGLYNIGTSAAAGTVVDVDFFASAVSVATALSGTNITFESGAAGGLITNGEKRVWESLGLTADPNLEYEVCATLTAAATANGTIVLRCQYVSGE